MFFLGIDIAKLNHVASLVSDNGNIVFSNFMFKNSLEGFLSLINKVKSIPKDDIVIALEFTGHYSDKFVNFFFNRKFNVTLVNPSNVANFRKSYGRDSKNDRIDSINIAKMLLSREYSLVTQSDIEYLSLKKLNRIRDSLVKQKSKCKILLTRNLDSIFPELHLLSSDIHSKAVYALLKKYPSSEEIAALGIDVLTNILKTNSRGHFCEKTAYIIKSQARSSVGFEDISLSFDISQLISSIELLKEQIRNTEKQINAIIEKLKPVILSIPGISNVACACILGEIGNISRFRSPSKLLAFAGLDPKIRQSGQFRALSCRMSKRGSKYLRYSLIYTAWNAVRNNEVFSNYYALKRSQGKNHYKALGHVAHKLVRVIYKLMKDNIPFNAEQLI